MTWFKPQHFIGARPLRRRLAYPRNVAPPPFQVLSGIKPWGGLWTSTWRPEGGTEWTEWCQAEHFGTPYAKAWLLWPSKSARVAVIDRLEDLGGLIQAFPGPTWGGRSGIDFEAAALELDGIHLTSEGQWATRLTQPNLYGWDCESTLWLRWVFDRTERAPDLQRPRPEA